MEFVVLLSLFAITLTQVMARAVNDTANLLETKDRNTVGQDASEKFKFTLPKVMRNKYAMNISGKLNLSDKNFAVMLPIEGNSKLQPYLRFNYEKNSEFEIFPEFFEGDKQWTIPRQTEDPDFYITLTVEDNSFIEIILTVVELAVSPLQTWAIENFESHNHIVFTEGVKDITSILFTF